MYIFDSFFLVLQTFIVSVLAACSGFDNYLYVPAYFWKLLLVLRGFACFCMQLVEGFCRISDGKTFSSL
jgi:hypothetical protein